MVTAASGSGSLKPELVGPGGPIGEQVSHSVGLRGMLEITWTWVSS